MGYMNFRSYLLASALTTATLTAATGSDVINGTCGSAGTNGGTTASCARPASNQVPAPAAAVGYNTNTFSTTRFSASDVDMKGTYLPGFQWYLYNFFGSHPTSAHIAFTGDGSVSVGQGGNGYNGTLASAGQINGYPGFVGTAFGGGAYIEAVVKFDAKKFNGVGIGWPAFWTNSLEGDIGTKSHYFEADLLEYFQGQWNDPLNTSHLGITDWYHPWPHYSVGAFYGSSQSEWSSYNTIAMLWVPATRSMNGYINFYYNGTLMFSQKYTQFTDSDQSAPSASTPWAFGIVDQQHLVIQAGASTTYPITIQSVNVWQANAKANLHH